MNGKYYVLANKNTKKFYSVVYKYKNGDLYAKLYSGTLEEATKFKTIDEAFDTGRMLLDKKQHNQYIKGEIVEAEVNYNVNFLI